MEHRQAEISSSSNPNSSYRPSPDNKSSVSILQEFYAKAGKIPRYDLTSTEDARSRPSAHYQKRVNYEVSVDNITATGSGYGKREAKEKAARALLNRLDPREVAKFERFPQSPSEGLKGRRPPEGLKGREIGLFYAQKQKKKAAQSSRDFIDISNEQLKQVENISRLLDENALDFKDGAFFGAIDYESEFMRAYQGNLDINAATSKSTDIESEEVDSWEMLEGAPPASTTAEANEMPSRSLPQKNKKLEDFRSKLPSYKMREEILKLIKANNVIVLSGETGCGKTTQIPQYILEDYLTSGRRRAKIVCTQPRRISAISVAERVAEERGERLGDSIGYQIRLESNLPKSRLGSILFCTTGIVLQWMRTDPELSQLTHLIVDEIHERDMQSDFILTLLKDLTKTRSDLKIILMSATLNADAFSKYFYNCPKVSIPGYTYPVKEYYLEDALEVTRLDLLKHLPQKPMQKWQKFTKRGKEKASQHTEYDGMIGPYIRNHLQDKYSRSTIEALKHPLSEKLNHDLVAALVHYLHGHEKSGAILVFLPGWDDISKVNTFLSKSGKYCLQNAVIYPLHSMMPTAGQRDIFVKPPPHLRKVILATNIAETSITIEDVVYVVDCGKIKMTKFDVQANIATFQPEWVSLANARQRRGRAGRVQPGVCYHLYTKAREMTLESYLMPEIQRKRLEDVILQIKVLGLGNVLKFVEKVMNPPEVEAVNLSLDLLRSLNAIDANEQLTPLGYHLSKLPMDPQLGKMILLGAIFSCLDPVLSVAASLSFKDPFVVPLGKEELVEKARFELAGDSRSDHLMMANVVMKWEYHVKQGTSRSFCYDYFLSESILKMLDHHKGQFAEHLHTMHFIGAANPKHRSANMNSDNEALVRAIICAGLYPNVAMIKKIRRNRAHGGSHESKCTVIMQTQREHHVELHPKSVNNLANGQFKYQWMTYHLKMRSTKVNLYDTSMVSPLSLVFFGQHLNHTTETLNGIESDVIKIDPMVRFNCDKTTYKVVKKLKEALNQYLAYRAANPGYTDWSQNTREGTLLSAIVKLLTLEVKVFSPVSAEPIESD